MIKWLTNIIQNLFIFSIARYVDMMFLNLKPIGLNVEIP